jgi:cell division protein ZipA
MLLLAGLVIIAGLYLAGRRGDRGGTGAAYNSRKVEFTRPFNKPVISSGSADQTSGESGVRIPESLLQNPVADEECADGYSQYADDIDWDDIDDLDMEWLDDITDDINYDELMYQLSQLQGQSAIADYLTGYAYPGRGEKVFVVGGMIDDEKINRAVQASTTIQPLVLVIHIISCHSRLMQGDAIESALKAAGMVPGEMQLFHLYEKPQMPGMRMHQQRIFSVANISEPGFFDFAHMADLKTPGISLIMQLPGPVEGLFAFERFYNVAKKLAGKLGGELYDVEKNKITKQTLNAMKQQITEQDIRLQLEKRPQVH